MDDDTIPTPTALKSILEKAKVLQYEFSFIGSLVKWSDGKSICQMNKPVIHANWIEEYPNFENGLLKIEKSSFVSCFVNLRIAKQVGLPITKFFIYGDDWEYTMRLGTIKSGYLDFESIVLHKMKENVTADAITVPKERISRCYYDFRNTFYIAKKSGVKEILKYPLIYLVWMGKILVKAKKYKIRRMWAITKGFLAGIFFNPKIEYVNPKEIEEK